MTDHTPSGLPQPQTVAEEAERAAFERDAEPMGFDLTRHYCAAPEPWSQYKDIDTGNRWGGWLARAALSAPAVETVAAQEAPKDWAKIEAFTDEYVSDYEMRGESEDGRDACYTPNDNDRALLRDCIAGLLAEPEFLAMLAAPLPVAPKAEPTIPDPAHYVVDGVEELRDYSQIDETLEDEIAITKLWTWRQVKAIAEQATPQADSAVAPKAEPEWIDDPHDIEQGMMRNPKWKPTPQADSAQPVATDTSQPWTLEHLRAYPSDALAILNKQRLKCDGNHGGPPCADRECWAREDAQPVVADTLTQAAQDLLDTELGDLACTGSDAPVEDALGRLRDALASPPRAPVGADTPKYNRAREMADEVMAELEGCSHGWNEDDIDRIQGVLLPRVYDCLNLLALASPARAIPAEQADDFSAIRPPMTRIAGVSPGVLERAAKRAAEQAAPTEPMEVGNLEYRGNSVSWWYAKAKAYGDTVLRMHKALTEAGHSQGRCSHVEDMLRAALAAHPHEAAPTELDERRKCRDCADFGPTCPNTGEPCEGEAADRSAEAKDAAAFRWLLANCIKEDEGGWLVLSFDTSRRAKDHVGSQAHWVGEDIYAAMGTPAAAEPGKGEE